MKRVNVLMSTYNGERFLHQQIESILRQDEVDVVLTVRDDGSTDKTCAILDEYQSQGLLTWYSGDNLGPARSFMQLLKDADEADYYAFADQDDFWKPKKLFAAITQLEKAHNKSALYFSPTTPADSDLQPLQRKEITPLLTFGESLIYEFVSGCTMVFTHELRQIMNTYSPSYLPMHDVWIYSVAQAIGASIVYDPLPYILYRQHANNVIGTNESVRQSWINRWKRFFSSEQSRSKRAQEIQKGFAPLLPQQNQQLLKNFVKGKHNLLTRISLLRDKHLKCGNKPTERLFRISLILNKY